MTLEIDCKTLINEVKKRKPLYDTSRKGYHDRSLKKKLWIEVCQKVYTSSVWDSMWSQDKIIYGKEVQKRWSSLRHCFRREVVMQRKGPLGAKKKRKYLYFDSLLFLLPFTENVNSVHNIKNVENDEDNIVDDSDDTMSPAESTVRKRKKRKKVKKASNKEECPTDDPKTHVNGQDEDELFLLSLVPYMKEFSGDQKLLLRMEIIKSILKFKESINSPRISDVNTIYIECIKSE